MALDHSVLKIRPVLGNTYQIKGFLGNTYKIIGFHVASGVFVLIVSY